MFFTQEDYIKIQQWLTKNSVKDTEFSEASIPFNGNEIVSIVQGNQNKRVFLKDLVSQIFNLGVSDFVNITDKYDSPNISLEEAIRLIPSRARKEGQVITFLDREDHWHIYQFKGVLNQWNVLDTWEDLFDWEKLIIDSILPDEEDLTKSPADTNGNSYLSLKDREYNPNEFSGLGRVILRKNVVELEDPIYGKVKKNVLTQGMINKSNTIYEIRYDFDLNGQEITIPESCVLDFQGGSLSNGTIDGSFNVLGFIKLNCGVKGAIYNYNVTPFYDEVVVSEHSYIREDLQTRYWITQIPNKDKNGNFIKLKVGLSKPIEEGLEAGGETATSFARRKKASLCINASVFNNFSSELTLYGSNVVDGQIISNHPDTGKFNKNLVALGLKEDNSFVFINADTKNGYAHLAKENDCPNMIQGFYPLMKDGVIESWISKEDSYLAPKCVIGQRENKDIVILTSDGRRSDNIGLNDFDVIEILKEYNCINIYKLDEGGSTSLVHKGVHINGYIDNYTEEREVGTFIYVSKEVDTVPQIEDFGYYISQCLKYINSVDVNIRTCISIKNPNEITKNGIYSIGTYYHSDSLNLPTFTDGNQIILGILIHLSNGFDSKKNAIQIAVDKNSRTIFYRFHYESADSYSDWTTFLFPYENAPGNGVIIGNTVFDKSSLSPKWWNGTEWVNVFNAFKHESDKLGSFLKRGQIITDCNNIPRGNGIFEGDSPLNAPKSNLGLVFILQFDYDVTSDANITQLLITKSNDALLYKRVKYASSNTWSDWVQINAFKGTSSERSAKYTGQMFFDTTLNKPIWWTGTKWVDATGADV